MTDKDKEKKKGKLPGDVIRAILSVAIVTLLISLFFLSMNHWGLARKKYIVKQVSLWEVYNPIPRSFSGDIRIVSGPIEEKKPGVFMVSDRIQALEGKTQKFLWETLAPDNTDNLTFTGFGLLMGRNPLRFYSLADGKIEREIQFDRDIISIQPGHLPNSIVTFDGMDVSLYDITGEVPHWTRRIFPGQMNQSLPLWASDESIIAGSRDRVFLLDARNGRIIGDIIPGEGHHYTVRGSSNNKKCILHLSPGKDESTGLLRLYNTKSDTDTPQEIKPAWEIRTAPPAGAPAITEYMVHTVSTDDRGQAVIHGWSLDDGEEIWWKPLPGIIPRQQQIALAEDSGTLMVIHPGAGVYWLDSRNGNQLKFVTIPADDSENPQGILTACRYKWYLFLYDSGSETLSALEVSINQMLKEKP